MAADLILAWARDFVLLMAHLALDVLVVLGAMITAGVVFMAAHEVVRLSWRQLRKQVKRSSERREWAEFVAAHPDADLIEVEDTPDA